MCCREVNFRFRDCGADVAGDVQVVVVVDDLLHGNTLGIPLFFFAEAVGVNNFLDMLFRQLILTLDLLEVLRRINEEYVVRLLAFLEHENTNRNSSGIEKVRGQADDGVDVAIVE